MKYYTLKIGYLYTLQTLYREGKLASLWMYFTAYMMHIRQLQDRCRKCQEMCRKCHVRIGSHTKWYPPFLCSGNVPDTPNFLCAGNVHEMSPVLLSNIFNYARKCLQEMWRKCTWNVMCPGYRKCTWHFMCPSSGNVPEILPYTAPGKVKEMSKFPGVGNVQEMWTFLDISWDFLAQEI